MKKVGIIGMQKGEEMSHLEVVDDLPRGLDAPPCISNSLIFCYKVVDILYGTQQSPVFFGV
jgi:hypothetical protein